MDKPSDIVKEGGKIATSLANNPQATERQRLDIVSNNKLAQAIRPVVLLWCLAMVTTFIIFDLKQIEINPEYIKIVKIAFWSAIAFYFPSRSIEKYFLDRKSKK